MLGLGCGPLDSKLVFIGEAPGRLGADASELPFHGDRAGHNFEALIEQVGLSRYHVFVTNAVLCNPKDSAGNNATPKSDEIRNCAPFLREQLELIDPALVVSLGSTALKACSAVSEHPFDLRSSVRTANKWFGRKLLPLYHPGQRAMVHRSFGNQLADYQFVAEQAGRLGQRRKAARRKTVREDSKLGEVARRILEHHSSGLSYFALHKLYFLSEVAHMEATGERLTNAYVIRQKDGPYCVDLHVARLPGMIPGLVVERSGERLMLRMPRQLTLDGRPARATLTEQELKSINHVSAQYCGRSDAELKRIAYLSKPMRAIMRRERSEGVNLFNSALLPYAPK